MALVFIAAALMVGLLGLSMVVAIVAFVLRAVVWLVLLPFKLAFLVLGLPILIVGSVGAVVVAVVGGVLLAGAGILAAVFASALLPLALVVFAIWALVRLSRRPVSA